MTVEQIRVGSEWLDLREPADAAARSRDLVEHVRRQLPAAGRLVIHDLACGSGSMSRWLAPLLPGPQLWVVHDRDADLLEVAAANHPGPAAHGAPVIVETRLSDITQLRPDDLAGATLITASALLDLITGDELADLVDLCSAVGCPVLLTLSVVGRVELAPADPLDRCLAGAFDAHQRRMTARGRLLGPDAVAAAAERFRRLGADVAVRPSPWRLGAARRRPGGGVANRMARCRLRTGGRAGRGSRCLRRPAPGASACRAAHRHRRPRRPAGAAVTTTALCNPDGDLVRIARRSDRREEPRAFREQDGAGHCGAGRVLRALP